MKAVFRIIGIMLFLFLTSLYALSIEPLPIVKSRRIGALFLAEEKDTLKMPIIDSLEEIIVSGHLQPISRMQSAMPVEVYSASFLQRQIQSDFLSLMSRINGVLPQTTCQVCNTGTIRVNGLDGPYTLILIDGMPIVSGLSTVYGLNGIPASLIKRIEVIKGPASTLYGSEAMAGMINIITKEPSQKEKWTVSTMGSSYNEWNTDLSGTLVFPKASSLIGVSHYRMNQRWDINKDQFTDMALTNRISVFNKWKLDFSQRVPVTMAWRYVYEDRWGGDMRWKPKYRGGDSIYGESIFINRVEVVANAGWTLFQQKMQLDLSFNDHRQDSYYGITAYDANQQTAFAQWHTSKKWNRLQLMTGIPFRWVRYDDQTPATFSAEFRTNRPQVNLSGGLFMQGEWQQNSRSLWMGGIRFETHRLHPPVISPRISWRYQLADQHVIRLSAGNGFRTINLFTEEHAALTGARTLVVKEALRPERSWNANLNHSTQYDLFKGLLSIESNFFYTLFTNRILPDYTTNPEQIIYSNLKGYSISRGFSVQADYNRSTGFRGNAGFTWIDAYRLEEGSEKERLFYNPSFSSTYGIGYAFQGNDLAVDITGTTTGPMRLPILPLDTRSEYSPWVTLLQVQAEYRLNKHLKLIAGVRNLLNYLPQNPILRPFDPFDRFVDDPVTNPNGYTFDASYSYAPMMPRRWFFSATFMF